MQVHLVDGTYELFRHFFAVPSVIDPTGVEIGAVRGVAASILGMLEGGATHVGVATDHVVESFRNQIYAGYKTGEGVPPLLMAQFPILEDALRAVGVVVWPLVEFEADDGLASAAARAAADDRVERVFVCSPDKDLAQCVSGERVVQLDRRRNALRGRDGVIEKFGVEPASIPDYLGLVGDSADGYPGLPGWGAKAASTVLARYGILESIPQDPREWNVNVRGAERLARTLIAQWDDALLYRDLATLRTDVPVFGEVDELRWRGPAPEFAAWCERLQAPDLLRRAAAITLV
ncbi:MAG: 5'-3' exonuclease H3TH domain-containing protein [Bryobacteraceae bacterium]